jgi:acetyltransferase-like isoleucine patch superfamily enzyme
VSIGEGAVVAAGALVVKPVAPHTLVAGSPATVMRDEVDGF